MNILTLEQGILEIDKFMISEVQFIFIKGEQLVLDQINSEASQRLPHLRIDRIAHNILYLQKGIFLPKYEVEKW